MGCTTPVSPDLKPSSGPDLRVAGLQETPRSQSKELTNLLFSTTNHTWFRIPSKHTNVNLNLLKSLLNINILHVFRSDKYKYCEENNLFCQIHKIKRLKRHLHVSYRTTEATSQQQQHQGNVDCEFSNRFTIIVTEAVVVEFKTNK